MALKNDLKEKKPTQADVESVAELLTEEQFEKRQRQKNKEKINRITRVAGTLAIILLVYVGIFDSLFELSLFGWLFTRSQHNAIWEQMRNVLDINTGEYIGSVYDNASHMMYDRDLILGKIGLTVLIIAVFILIVYFITYNIVDLIAMIKSMFLTGKNITKDLSGNIHDTFEADKKQNKSSKQTPKKKRLSLFSKEELEDMGASDDEEKKEKKVRRRKETESSEFEGYSSEQLDALLSGKTFDEVATETEDTSAT